MISLQHFQRYYVWITGNILWAFFAFKHKHYGLLFLSISYLIINSIGIVRWQFFLV
ncbi:MAG: hypothetical protein AABX16_03960 [Nanoarchaeota archaeon]